MSRAPFCVVLPAVFALLAGCPEPASPTDAGGRLIDPLPVVDGGADTFPDAGPQADGGTPPADAGTPADAGAPVDAGLPADGGAPADAGYDAGPPADAGVDAGPVLCPGDDALGGAVGAPADITGVQPTDGLRTCVGAESADVFTVTATAGERLRLTAATAGYLDGDTVVAGVEPDLALYLLSAPPAVNDQGQLVLLLLDDAITDEAWERVSADIDADGTYYVVVTAFDGPPVDYNLTLERETACQTDADCTAGTETCQVGIDLDLLRVLQTCEQWVPVACGVGVEEGGADNHSDSGAYALAGPVTATSCPGDVDVFTLTATVGDTLAIDVDAAAIALNQFLVVTLVDPRGEIASVDLAYLQEPSLQLREFLVEHAGEWLVYVEHFPPGLVSADLSYDVDARVLSACRTDADCINADVCGGQLDDFAGILSACAPDPGDTCGENDADNSMTGAQVLAPTTGVQLDVAGNNTCMRGPDWFKVPLTEAVNALAITLTWADPSADLDLWLFGPDGSFLGGALFGANSEDLLAQALPAGDYYVVVDTFACGFDADGAIACPTLFPYQLAVNVGPGQACTADVQCEVGGTLADDIRVPLTCETTAGLCERPTPAALLTVAGGGACFDSYECSSALCVDDACTARCTESAPCDAVLGTGAYCPTELLGDALCVEACLVDADCIAFFGDGPITCVTGECVFTP